MISTTTAVDKLSDAMVLDPGGAKVALKSAWAERPAVLVFLRHFG